MSAPTISTDLFSLVESALWFVLESHPEFAVLVSGRNRIRFEGDDPDPGKPGERDADMPEVRLIQAGPQSPQRQTSSGCDYDLGYTLQIKTSAKTTNRTGAINQCLDVCIRAFRSWEDKLPDVPEAVMVRVGQAPTNIDGDGGDTGWIAAAQISVTLSVPRWAMESSAWQ